MNQKRDTKGFADISPKVLRRWGEVRRMNKNIKAIFIVLGTACLVFGLFLIKQSRKEDFNEYL